MALGGDLGSRDRVRKRLLGVLLLFQTSDTCPSEDPRVAAVPGIVLGLLLVPGGIGLLRDPVRHGSEEGSAVEHRITDTVGYPAFRCSCGQAFTTQDGAESHVEAVTTR
jgi:hypothetical protein